MKRLIAVIMAASIFSSCASSSSSSSDEGIYLQRANCKISVNIYKDLDGYKLGMVFENQSANPVRLQNPECINQSVIVYVRSRSGEQMPLQEAVNADSCGNLITIEPGAKRTFVLPSTLEKLYGLKTPGKYKVNFEYIGGFYEESGMMSGEEILKSSAAEFAVK